MSEGRGAVELWQAFFTAQAGASAALSGLVFVALSINLTKILELSETYHNRLAERALGALAALLAILIASSLLLAPGVSVGVIGLELLIVGLVDWGIQLVIQAQRWRTIDPRYRARSILTGLGGQLSALFIAWAGAAVIVLGLGALYWLLPGIILSYLFAIEEAWVLLVEINR